MGVRGLASSMVVAVILAAAGAAGALVLEGEQVPAELQAASEPLSAPTSTQKFADERTVEARFVIREPAPLTLRATGTVTASRCVPGRSLSSGATAIEVNDEPVIVLHSSVPLYRDLKKGAAGNDVASVQEELSRLGYQVNTDGDFGAETVAAVKRFQEDIGYSKPDGQILLSRVVWIRHRTVTPSGCALKLGDLVAPGATLADVGGGLSSVRVSALPADLVQGRRTITVFGVTGPLTKKQSATDRKFLAAVAATPEYQALIAEKSPDPVTITISLAEPLDTVKVPPAAIFAMSRSRGCIQSGQRTLPVVVVGSGLGASLVTLTGKPPASVNLGSAITATGCR